MYVFDSFSKEFDHLTHVGITSLYISFVVIVLSWSRLKMAAEIEQELALFRLGGTVFSLAVLKRFTVGK